MNESTTQSSTFYEKLRRLFATRIGKAVLAITSVVIMIGILIVLFTWLDLERYFDDFVEGVTTTMLLYVFALVFGFFVGLVFAIARVYGGPIISRIATAYIEVIRGTPVVTQVIIIAYLPDTINILLEAQGYL